VGITGYKNGESDFFVNFALSSCRHGISNQVTDMKPVYALYHVVSTVISTVNPIIPGDYKLLKLGIRFLVNCGLSDY